MLLEIEIYTIKEHNEIIPNRILHDLIKQYNLYDFTIFLYLKKYFI